MSYLLASVIAILAYEYVIKTFIITKNINTNLISVFFFILYPPIKFI